MAGTIVLSDTIQRYLGPRHSHLARAAVPLAEADDADRNAERADAGHPQPKRKVIVRLFP